MSCRLLVATNNKGKVIEYRSLLAGHDLELVTMAQAGITTVTQETGATYEENALLKATSTAIASGLVSLGDDSGLEVDALQGEPGVMSARYAGENASDADRINLLLERINGVPWEHRWASFRCVIALATPQGDMATCTGECRGIISLQPKGTNGHGYDPVFYIPELGKTMAELTLDQKNLVSHRGRAAAEALSLLSRPPFSCLERDRL